MSVMQIRRVNVALTLVSGLFFVLFLLVPRAGAVGSLAPDPGDFTAGARVYTVVAQAESGNNLDAPSSRITIYSLSKTPKVTIYNPNQCRGGDPDTTNNPTDTSLKFTTSFQFFWDDGATTGRKEPAGSKDPDNNQWGTNYIDTVGSGQCTAANNKWSTNFNLPETAARTLDGQKYYIVDLIVDMRTDVKHGSVNAFKVETDSGTVSFSSSSTKKFALQDRTGTDNSYSTFNLYFAMPCNAVTEEKTFEWFDADQGTGNQPEQAKYQLWRKPRNGGAWEKQGPEITDLGGNDEEGSRKHWLSSAYVYNWQWIHIRKTNGIQFQIPYNSINASLVCKEEAKVDPRVSLSPIDNVMYGEEATAGASFKNNSTATARVKYTRQFWKANAQNGFSAAEGDVAVHAAVTDTVNVTGNTTLNLPDWKVTATGTHSYLCTALIDVEAVDTADVDTIVSAATAGPVCRVVGKFPSFVVESGDIRSGGNYGNTSCSVARPASIQADTDKLNHYFGVIAHSYSNVDGLNNYHHSYVRDGVISLGNIENIVSKKAAIGNGADTTLHFARGPGATAPANTVLGGGRFYGEFDDMPAPPASVKTHCLSPLFANNRYPASTATINAGAAVTTRNLPAPAAGATATTYNICGNTPDKLLVLNGPAGGDLVLSSGQQYIVRVTQNGAGCNAHPVHVRINKNIRYTGTVATIDKLPQFVFLAGSNATSRVYIQIDNGVTRLDGIYANRGNSRFLTCAQRANSPSGRTGSRDIVVSDCSNRLTVNGVIVLAGRLEPYRTAGHDDLGNTDPAEAFTLRPDVLLSDFARDRVGSQLENVNLRELAPRF